MVTAFVDMVGLLMVLPLLPYYATRFVGQGPLWRAMDSVGMGGEGTVIAILVSSFAVAQLLSAPLWGRVSDRYGRRPVLLLGFFGLGANFFLTAFATGISMLIVARLMGGAMQPQGHGSSISRSTRHFAWCWSAQCTSRNPYR